MTGTRSLAGIQYMYGKASIVRLLQFGDEIRSATLLTLPSDYCSDHAYILEVNADRLIAIRGGFTSGYDGEGPSNLSRSILLLEAFDIRLREVEVSQELLMRLNESALTTNDMNFIQLAENVKPLMWDKYILSEVMSHRKLRDEFVGEQFPFSMPFSILDNRIFDLAIEFNEDTDKAILSGYRRLEGFIRNKIVSNRHGTKLFSEAFQGEGSKLYWKGLAVSEQVGRANLFTGVYMAFRNKRAHHEPNGYEDPPLSEFLLLNQLYLFEKTALIKE